MLDNIGLQAVSPEFFAFTFALVLARTSTAIMLLPGLAEVEGLPMIRAGLALCLTILILPSITSSSIKPLDPGAEAALQLVAEITTGLAWGFLARVWVQVATVFAQLAAYMLGLSSLLQPDPELGPQTTAIARLFSLATPVIILASGLYKLPIQALCDSYELVPVGSFMSIARFSEASTNAVAMTFGIAVKMVLPLMLASAGWHASLGLISRLIPRIQVYFIAVPAQILGGTLLFSMICTRIFLGIYESIEIGMQQH